MNYRLLLLNGLVPVLLSVWNLLGVSGSGSHILLPLVGSSSLKGSQPSISISKSIASSWFLDSFWLIRDLTNEWIELLYFLVPRTVFFRDSCLHYISHLNLGSVPNDKRFVFSSFKLSHFHIAIKVFFSDLVHSDFDFMRSSFFDSGFAISVFGFSFFAEFRRPQFVFGCCCFRNIEALVWILGYFFNL